MTQKIEINQDQITNFRTNKHISLSENAKHDTFQIEIKNNYNQKTETEGQEVMLNEKNNNQCIYIIINFYSSSSH